MKVNENGNVVGHRKNPDKPYLVCKSNSR